MPFWEFFMKNELRKVDFWIRKVSRFILFAQLGYHQVCLNIEVVKYVCFFINITFSFLFPGYPHYDDDENLGPNVSSYPYFEFNVPRNVTTAVGQTAFLHCRVEQLGDKAVSILFN